MGASIVKLRPNAKDELTHALGMMIALGAWSMMFGALFFIYAGMRAQAPMWPPAGAPRLPLALPAVNTLVLAASSLALQRGISRLAQGRRRALAPWTGAAMILGAAFLGLQLVVWRAQWAAGLYPSSSAYGSVFYGLTALHALHVAAGLLVLLVVLVRALLGRYTEHNVVRVRVAAMFWHFVDVVWLLMFISVYLF